VPAVPASLKTRVTITGAWFAWLITMSIEPRPVWPIVPTMSGYDTLWPTPIVKVRMGSDAEPGVPAGWDTKRPEIALLHGLNICTLVRKNEPKLPGVDAAAGMTRATDSVAVPVAWTARVSPEVTCADESETSPVTSPEYAT